MVDYYEELSLEKELDIKHIQEELVRLESLWHKREVNSPEKANKMLGLIMDAQKAFASEDSRRKYDNSLEMSRKESEDPDVSRSKSLEKWMSQARNFFDDGQYDLAKAAIDQALACAGDGFNDGNLFQLATDIYLKNNDIRLSIDCINKAIISSPDCAVYYVTKAQVFERKAQLEEQFDRRQHDINECRNNLKNAVSKAQTNGDQDIEAVALGMLAFSLCFHPGSDMVLAEEYAGRAKELGEQANSAKVLNSVMENRNAPIYNEAQKEERVGDLQHLKKALELYDRLTDWRDASVRAVACRTRIRQLEEAENRLQQVEQRLWMERNRKAKEAKEERERKAKEEEKERERREQAELEAQRKKKEWTIKLVKLAILIVVVLVVVNSL